MVCVREPCCQLSISENLAFQLMKEEECFLFMSEVKNGMPISKEFYSSIIILILTRKLHTSNLLWFCYMMFSGGILQTLIDFLSVRGDRSSTYPFLADSFKFIRFCGQ